MDSFVYTSSPSRVIFGQGRVASLPDELSRQNLKSPVFLATPQQADYVQTLRSSVGAQYTTGIFTEATMHTPTHVTERALAYVESINADSIVSVGGGSTIGLGKAVSIRTGLPHICIPTTYAGSEMTPILGESADGQKKTRSDPKILPGTVIYDVDLTMTLPAEMSATSGVNAIAHAGTLENLAPSFTKALTWGCAVEALYAKNGNPIISLLAFEGVRALAESLPIIVNEPSNLAARSSAQYGAWLCGLCLGSVGMSLHHKLCHTLGGSFNLPHAETHTIVLPHALAYNAPSVPLAMEKLATALPDSEGDAIKGLNVLLARLGVKRALADYGLKEGDVDRAAELAVANPYWNPREIEKAPVRELIRRAFAGEDARADI